ncbi:hypothetical protein IWW38_005419, partial [Coemansia aciculifera]
MADDLLRLWVLQEEQVVTYRRLSRELRVHVNVAKQAMLEFYEASKSNCHATFLVTGSKRPSASNKSSSSSELPELLIKLVPAADLSSAQQDLDNAAFHIYSIERHATNGKHVLTTANISAGPIRDMAELSVVGSSVTRVSVASVSRAPPVKAEKIAVASSAGSIDSSADMQSQTDAPSASSPAVKPKSSKSFFGKQIAKSVHTKKQSADSQAEPAEVSIKVEAKTPIESQADSDVDMDNAESSRAENKRRIEDMFDDDDDDDFENFDDISSAAESRSNRETQVTATTASRDASDIEMSDSESREASANDSNADSQDMQVVVDSQQPGDGNRRVRKRRKVSRIKHTKNSRNMLVTQTVDEW